MKYKAFIKKSQKEEGSFQTLELPELKSGEVLIKNEYSSINYKDALAITGKGKILKTYPIVPGIDLSGKIYASKSKKWKEGDSVLVTGCGLGEIYSGGYGEYTKVSEDVVISIPTGYSSRDVMVLGTAGFTAALALHRMERNGQRPSLGPILISGASGGVGSIATMIFSKSNYEVMALTGKRSAHDYLKTLGASQIISEEELSLGDRPLESVRFGGVVDNLGGDFLAKALTHVEIYGNMASIGLAKAHNFSLTVMPFILRGVSLLGISSNNCGLSWREEIWKSLPEILPSPELKKLHQDEVSLDDIEVSIEDYFQRKILGRRIVRIGLST